MPATLTRDLIHDELRRRGFKRQTSSRASLEIYVREGGQVGWINGDAVNVSNDGYGECTLVVPCDSSTDELIKTLESRGINYTYDRMWSLRLHFPDTIGS